GPTPMELDYARNSLSNHKHEKNEQKEIVLKDGTEPTSYNVTNNSLELTQVEGNREQLLRFYDKINGHSAWILLDSGASYNFIDENFIACHKLTSKIVSSLTVELASDQKASTNKAIDIIKLELGPYNISDISVQVLKLQHYDAILGKPWLYYANPNINWRKNTLVFQYGSKTIEVQADPRNTYKEYSCNLVFISQQQLAKVPSNEEIYTIHVNKEDNGNTSHPLLEVRKIL
ncbi:11773_t:CDS:2, partial [Racocetra fulgida]